MTRERLHQAPRWAGVAAAIILMLMAGCAGSPAPSPTLTPTASPPPTPRPSPTETATASPTASPSSTPGPIGWTTLSWSKGVTPTDGQIVLDLLPRSQGDGYVGVGGIDTGSGLEAAFYTSPDAIHWTLAQRQTTPDRNVWVEQVIQVGNRLLAIGGAVMNAPQQKPDFAPFLWRSDDGLHWTRLQSGTWDAAMWGLGVQRLISGPEGVLAVSFAANAVVLHSLDGATWTPVTLPVSVRAIPMDAIGYSGGFVIVGRDGQPDLFTEVCESSCPPPGVGRPAAWVSRDGLHWSEASVEGDAVAGGALSRVVAHRAGLLAVGTSSTADYYAGKLTSWSSADAQSWSIAGGARLPAETGAYPVLAGDGEHAVLFGPAPDGAGLAAWTIADDVSWKRLGSEGVRRRPTAARRGASGCSRRGSWRRVSSFSGLPARSILRPSGSRSGTRSWRSRLFFGRLPSEPRLDRRRC